MLDNKSDMHTQIIHPTKICVHVIQNEKYTCRAKRNKIAVSWVETDTTNIGLALNSVD